MQTLHVLNMTVMIIGTIIFDLQLQYVLFEWVNNWVFLKAKGTPLHAPFDTSPLYSDKYH